MDELEKNIRKLRKKLRQIDQLSTLTRDLNDDEILKVERLPVIRDELQLLLKKQKNSTDSSDAFHEPLSTVEIRSENQSNAAEESVLLPYLTLQETDDEEECKESGIESKEEAQEEHQGGEGDLQDKKKESQTVNVSKRKPEESSFESKAKCSTEPQPEVKKKKMQKVDDKNGESKLSQKKPQTQAVPPWWRQKPRYFVQELVSHQDIILDVSISDGLLASASRDSQVKVWSLDSGALECTLSGHSEAAQACQMLPEAVSVALAEALAVPASSRLVVTGGGDSHLLLWRVDAGLRRATELRRIYTFTPITGLVHLQQEEGLRVAVGTSSGKIEVWDLLEKCLVRSRQLHRSPVTCLRLVSLPTGGSPVLLSCAEDGDVTLLRVNDLASLYVAGEASTRRGVRHNAAVCLGAERILVADSGASLKLHRRGHQGVQRVANSRHEFGLCDALWTGSSRLVIASAFDVDFGRGYLNLHNFEDAARPTYLMSLEPPQCTGRFLCLDALHDQAAEYPSVIVSGGIDLLLWQRLPTTSDFAEAECSRIRTYRLFRPVAGQEFSDASGISSDETSGAEDEDEGGPGQLVRHRSWWWCNML